MLHSLWVSYERIRIPSNTAISIAPCNNTLLTSCDVRLLEFVRESEVTFCQTERNSNMEER